MLEWWRATFWCLVGSLQRNVLLLPHTRPGRKRCTDILPEGAPGFGSTTFNPQFSPLTSAPQSPWTKVCPSLREDSGQTQWSPCWPDRSRWTAWFLEERQAVGWKQLWSQEVRGQAKTGADLISWPDSGSRAGSCGLCRSSAAGPAATARRRSASPLTWRTAASGF